MRDFDRALARPLEAIQARRPVTQVERLGDLSALCDALLLYDKLYVLRCESWLDAGSLVLRNALSELGILEEVDTAAHSAVIAGELVKFLRAATGGAEYGLLADIGAVVQGFLNADDGSAEYDRTATMIDLFRDGVEGIIAVPSAELAGPDPLAAVARKVIADVQYFGSGSLFGAVSNIRTFVYWRLATHLELPMYPSARRLLSYQAITRHIDRSLRERAYAAVAEAFQTTVSEVYETDARPPIYLPPGAAIFLDIMREHRSVTQSLLTMRARFQPLRDAFRKLQEDAATARTIGELHRHQQRFANVLEELRTPDGAGGAGLEIAIDLLPEIARVAANPLDLSAYGDNLIRKPALWLQNWWRRRPYRLVFRLRERLLDIADYPRLLHDVTGVHISDQELREFVARHRDESHHQMARKPGSITQVVADP